MAVAESTAQPKKRKVGVETYWLSFFVDERGIPKG
jgi:hypothetical protein